MQKFTLRIALAVVLLTIKSGYCQQVNLKNLKIFDVPKNIAALRFSSERNNIVLEAPLQDTDNDGLTDDMEKKIGTLPDNPDTDGDALLDGWEVGSVDGIDLRTYGASPLYKDIFVEMDYMVRPNATLGLGPNDNVLKQITENFAKSPVTNPNGQTGIRIHLFIGEQVPYDEDLNPLLPEFANLKRNNFAPNRSKVFHYMIWADTYNGTTSSGYSLDMPGADFIVTLGAWNNRAGGTDNQKIGTFIHELGHNLGLRHGGNDHINFKPNFISVMNYHFQMSGIPKSNGPGIIFEYSYQPFVLASLDENNIDESKGIGNGPDLLRYNIRYYHNGNPFQTKASPPIDWSRNTITDSPYQKDVNGDGFYTSLEATPNEWSQLFFNGGDIGSGKPLLGIVEKAITNYVLMQTVELTEEMSQKLQEYKEE